MTDTSCVSKVLPNLTFPIELRKARKTHAYFRGVGEIKNSSIFYHYEQKNESSKSTWTTYSMTMSLRMDP